MRLRSWSPHGDEGALAFGGGRGYPGWKPETSGRQLRLELSIADPVIHEGGHIRYRLDIQNIGDQDVTFVEKPSFLKNDLYGNEYKFILTLPDGSEDRLFRFRTLETAYDFSDPGTYQIRVIYDLTRIPDGTRAESNSVRFVVVP